MVINEICKVGKVIKLIFAVWGMVTVILENVCCICMTQCIRQHFLKWLFFSFLFFMVIVSG